MGAASCISGSNHISGDGTPVDAMIQAAWQADHFHLDWRTKVPAQTYRYAATVPKGRESELLPALQDAIERNFGFRMHWEDQERDALVLSRLPTADLNSESSEPLFVFMRGKITLKKQTVAKLVEALPNSMQKPVVDETGLSGLYDFELEYRACYAPRRPQEKVRPDTHSGQTHHQDVGDRVEVEPARERAYFS